MSVEKVREYLKGYGVADRMQEFTVSSATVELAAVAVGVEPARIAKTLSFKVDETPVLIVAAGDAKVDNSKYKHFFHTKAKMLTHEEAVERIGHAVGGVCPFALPAEVKTYLDVSLKRCFLQWAAPPRPLSSPATSWSAAAAITSWSGWTCVRAGRTTSPRHEAPACGGSASGQRFCGSAGGEGGPLPPGEPGYPAPYGGLGQRP